MRLQLTKSQLHRTARLASVLAVIAIILTVAVISSGRSKIPAIEVCLPTFRDGGGPYYQPDAPFRSKIVPDQNNGKKMIISGYVLTTDCSKTVSGAVIDIWQANESGDYEDEWYRGQITTDSNGYYQFETVMPLGYGEGTAYRPPHIHFKVFVEGREIVTSQMFFADVKGREGFNDEYIISTTEKSNLIEGTHHIILPDFY